MSEVVAASLVTATVWAAVAVSTGAGAPAALATTTAPARIAPARIAPARTTPARTGSPSASELCSGYAACTSIGYSSHDYQDHSWTSYWSMDAGDECTNYAAYVESAVYKVATPSYLLGDAGSWADNARAHGVLVNHTPSVGAVAEWDAYSSGIGPAGHVGIVERVGPNDSYIDVSQQHIASDVDGYDWERIAAGNQSWEPWPSNFIHFVVPAEHVAVHVNSGGRMQAFLVGATSHLYTKWQTKQGKWSGWRNLGGNWPAGDPITAGFNSGAPARGLPRRARLPVVHRMAEGVRPVVCMDAARRQLADRQLGRTRLRYRWADTAVCGRIRCPAPHDVADGAGLLVRLADARWIWPGDDTVTVAADA